MAKIDRWAVVLTLSLLFASVSHAQTALPPDGASSAKSGGKSTPIYSLTTPLTFSPCAGATGDVLFDCNLFPGGAQEIFAGVNDSSQPWNRLSVTLGGYNSKTDPVVTCSGGTIFSSCVPIISGSTVTFSFTQGTGTGIECNTSGKNGQSCEAYSYNALVYDFENPGSTPLPYDWKTCPGPVPGAVCGPDEFVIAIGNNGTQADFFITPLSSVGTLVANTPEPGTFGLVGVAGFFLLLSLRKLS